MNTTGMKMKLNYSAKNVADNNMKIDFDIGSIQPPIEL